VYLPSLCIFVVFTFKDSLINGSDKNDKTCDTLSLEDKTSYEKIHI
jgi:hypothetical protein